MLRPERAAYPERRAHAAREARPSEVTMADLQAPRGMSDLLPEDEALWRYVRDTAERVARLFDYRLISTPIVEDVGVFARTVGADSDIVSKEMYVFEDRGGGTLALRPEGTAAVCRAYLEHGMASRPQPVRLYYLGPMFRYDRPQAGRYRQLWQFGVECIGDASPAADVEIIELQHTLFRELGLDDLVLRINSIGTAETRREYVEVLREHFRPHLESLSLDSQRRFATNVLRILDSKEDAAHRAVREAPSILDHLSEADRLHFDEVKSSLRDRQIDFEEAPSIVRGLDYYARTVWEFEPPDAGGQGTVSAGGRYDGLLELLGGAPTPGTGTAMGLERTMLNLRRRGIEPPWWYTENVPDLYIVLASRSAAARASELATALRRRGFSVIVGSADRSLRGQLRQASRRASRFAVVIGAKEISDGVVEIRDLEASRDEARIPLADVAHALVLQRRALENALEGTPPALAQAVGALPKRHVPEVEDFLQYCQVALLQRWPRFTSETLPKLESAAAWGRIDAIGDIISSLRSLQRRRAPAPADPGLYNRVMDLEPDELD